MTERECIRLGVVQPIVRWGNQEPRMLEDAVAYIGQAAGLGVDLLLFPETYPGPRTAAVRYEVVDRLAEAAARHGVALAAGTTTKTGTQDTETYHVSQVLIDANGQVKGFYHRTHPRGPVYEGLYKSEPFWGIQYVAGDSLPIFDLGWGKVAISICSEVFVPEVARAMALQGAELCLFPTGVMIDDFGFTENWRTMVRARAIENMMFTATTMNLFPPELRGYYDTAGQLPVSSGSEANSGHATIASPERVLAASSAPGLLTADLDLTRLRLMRTSPEFPEGVEIPPPFGSLPGLFRLRRPEMAGALTEEAPAIGESPRHVAPSVPISAGS